MAEECGSPRSRHLVCFIGGVVRTLPVDLRQCIAKAVDVVVDSKGQLIQQSELVL